MADQIDWNVELRKIEREYDGLPPEPSADQIRTKRAAEKRARDKQDATNAMIGGSIRLGLVTLLAAAVTFWPYPNRCGAGLFIYLWVGAVLIAGAVWVAGYTWQRRLPRMHIVSILLAVGGLVLIAAQVLPRTGYARTDRAHPAEWMCVAP